MAYSPTARRLRRCSYVFPEGHPNAGWPCSAFAMWGTEGATEGRGLCSAHAGRTRGEDRRGKRLAPYECRTVPKCECGAYPFPHRPGGGLCRWPEPPRQRLHVRTAYGMRTRWTPRRLRGYTSPTKRTAPDVTPPGTPPAYAVTPTVSYRPTPAAARDAWVSAFATRAARWGRRRG